MKRTLPQIIMLNHAAWLEKKELDARHATDKSRDEYKQKEDNADPFIPEYKMRLSKLQQHPALFERYMLSI